jgi:hypothetical protein
MSLIIPTDRKIGSGRLLFCMEDPTDATLAGNQKETGFG